MLKNTFPITRLQTNDQPLFNQVTLAMVLVVSGVLIGLLPIKLALLTVVGIIVLLLSLINPKIPFYLLIPAIPFSSIVQVSIGGVNLGPMEGLLGLMLVSWLLQMARQQAIIMPGPPLVGAFLWLLATFGLSWLNAISVKSSLVETVKWLEMLAIYLFVWAKCSKQDRDMIIALILLAGLAQAGLGLYQFFFKVGPEGFLLFGGRFLRAYGTFRQPNPYAGYLGLILPLSLSLTLWSLSQLPTKAYHWKSIVLAISLSGISLLMVAALLASQSRGALLGFMAAISLTVLLKGGRWAAAFGLSLIIGAMLISMGLLAYLPTTLTARFVDAIPFLNVPDIAQIQVTDANFAIVERLAHWQAAIHMWRDHFWLGVGIGNYEVAYASYAIGPWLDPLGHAHNYLLNIGAEAGFIGVLGYLLFWVLIVKYILAGLVSTATLSLERAIFAGVLGILAHLHLHNMLDNLYVQGMYLHIAVLLSLITVMERPPSASEDHQAHR